MYFSMQVDRQVDSFEVSELEGEGMQAWKQFLMVRILILADSLVTEKQGLRRLRRVEIEDGRSRELETYSLIFWMRAFALAILDSCWSWEMMRVFTSLEEEGEVVVEEGEDEELDDEEPKKEDMALRSG